MIYSTKKTNLIYPLALLLLLTQGGVHANTIVYGLNQARHVGPSAKGPFYIQLASFSSAERAKRYAGALKLHPSYPVIIAQHGSFHVVEVGPIASVSAMRSVRLTKGRVFAPVKRHAKMRTTPVVQSTLSLPANKSGEFDSRGLMGGQSFVQADIGLTVTPKTGVIQVNNGAVDPAPANQDVYTTHEHQRGGMVSLIAGWRWQRARTYLPAYSAGFRYQNVFNQHIQGTITEYSNPVFKNYNYDWTIQSNVFSVVSKMDLLEYHHFSPYVDLGLGCALNQSRRFEETALPGVFSARVSPAYTNHDNTKLSYTLGAGLNYQVNQQVLVSVGYEFQDFGAISTGRGQSTWSTQRLVLDHYRTSTALLSMSYLFGEGSKD